MVPSVPNPKLIHSLALLQSSEYLGVIIADVDRISDANDAFLRMVGYSRQELEEGLMDWRAMTPPEFVPLDNRAVEELRENGACVPFEKEYVRRDGERLPILLGGLRLNLEPLQTVCFVVDLRPQRQAEILRQRYRDLNAKTELIGTLAHKINNPLAILTNVFYLLGSREELSPEVTRLIAEAQEATNRIEQTLTELMERVKAE